MGWELISQRTESIATITAPTGDIFFPAYEELYLGITKTFTFKGKNTSGVGQTMRLLARIYDPQALFRESGVKDESLAPSALVSLPVEITFDKSGVWYAVLELFTWY